MVPVLDCLTLCLCMGHVGSAGGTFNMDNSYTNFQTAPQIYDPKAPLGTRWSDYLADSGIARGYHAGALLIASGEVRHFPESAAGDNLHTSH